jgi:ParB family chromosome partitioning protein
MNNVQATLRRISGHLEESIGRRPNQPTVALSPVARPQDIGRRPIRDVGTVEIEQVVPDPDQHRKQFNEADLERLAASIREKGQLSPIRVRWNVEQQKWMVIAGERRWRATKLAGLPTIECYFHESELTASEVLEQQLIENCLRVDLTPIEEARAFQSLMQINGWTGKQVSRELHIAPSQVSRHLALLGLSTVIQEFINAGQIPARTAYELTKVKSEAARRNLAKKAVAGQLSADHATRQARKLRSKAKEPRRGTSLTFVAENKWKVVVTARRKGTYEEVEQTLEEVLAEVRHRIRNNVQLF